jgi:hypothetical protein
LLTISGPDAGFSKLVCSDGLGYNSAAVSTWLLTGVEDRHLLLHADSKVGLRTTLNVPLWSF